MPQPSLARRSVVLARMSGRLRFKGDEDGLVALLSPHVTGVSWIRYDEASKVQKSNTDASLIQPHIEFIEDVHEVAPNLSLNKVPCQVAFRQIFEKKGFDRVIPGEDMKEDWVMTMTMRVRNMLRATQQACRQSPPPSWTLAFSWMAEGQPGLEALVAVGDEEGEGGAEQARIKDAVAAPIKDGAETPKRAKDHDIEGDIVWKFEWSEEHGSVYRWNSTDPHAIPQVAERREEPKSGNDDDEMLFTWQDGMARTFDDVTLKAYRSWQEVHNGTASSTNYIYEGEHATSHNRLIVKFQKDRGLLVTLWEQGKMVCMVQVSDFGGEEASHKDAAANVMKKLALQFETGKLARGDLYPERDKELAKYGITKTRSKAAKAAGVKASAEIEGQAVAERVEGQIVAPHGDFGAVAEPAPANKRRKVWRKGMEAEAAPKAKSVPKKLTPPSGTGLGTKFEQRDELPEDPIESGSEVKDETPMKAMAAGTRVLRRPAAAKAIPLSSSSNGGLQVPPPKAAGVQIGMGKDPESSASEPKAASQPKAASGSADGHDDKDKDKDKGKSPTLKVAAVKVKRAKSDEQTTPEKVPPCTDVGNDHFCTLQVFKATFRNHMSYSSYDFEK